MAVSFEQQQIVRCIITSSILGEEMMSVTVRILGTLTHILLIGFFFHLDPPVSTQQSRWYCGYPIDTDR